MVIVIIEIFAGGKNGKAKANGVNNCLIIQMVINRLKMFMQMVSNFIIFF